MRDRPQRPHPGKCPGLLRWRRGACCRGWAIDPYGSQPLSLKYRPYRNPVKRDPMNKGEKGGWARTNAADKLSGTGSQKGAHLARRWADGRISTLGATQYACARRRSEDTCPQPRLPSAGEAGGGLRANSGRDRPADRGVAKRPWLIPRRLVPLVGIPGAEDPKAVPTVSSTTLRCL
jgi:hypothetical protein